MRILVTGAREWTDYQAISTALFKHARFGDTLIHGAAEGADILAARHWQAFGPLEPYPAKDFPSPRARNQHMVDLGADVCLAFALKWASGTGMCARMARKAGIPVIDYGVSTDWSDRP